MADVTLTGLLGTNPVTAALTGDEPIETVVSAVSEAAELRQLSFAPLKDLAGTSYNLVLIDQGKVLTPSNGAANTVTIPLNSSVAFPIGATLLVRQIGTGQTTIVAAGGVTIQKKVSSTLAIGERYGQIVLHKIDTDTWHTTGEYLAL